jgi:hypothetical protein
MLYMLVNRTRTDLTPEQYQALGRMAQSFYDRIPEGVKILGDWAATDRSRTFALLETDDPALLEQIEAPFRPYVDIETFEVAPVKGWNAR